MKLKHILISGLGVCLLSSCLDDIEAPSKYTTEFIYNSPVETSTALNGVYAKALTGNTFGSNLYNSLMLNSDVDYASNSSENADYNQPRRFDLNANSNAAENLWDNLYSGVEVANIFIGNLQKSDIYNSGNEAWADLTQMMGEAKVLRAMFYNELLDYYGDIPFSFEASFETGNTILPIVDRDNARWQIVNDLVEIAPQMKSVKNIAEGVERISKEACYAMAARMALQGAGYSLRAEKGANTYGTMGRQPGTVTLPSESGVAKITGKSNVSADDFYTVARACADSVIKSNTHSLIKDFKQVFIDECNLIVNNDDDPIFELPFAKETSGNWGYNQGPSAAADGNETIHNWGKTSGGVGLEAFYRFTFAENDQRRDYIAGLQNWSANAVPAVAAGYRDYNNKWSKLWNEVGLGKSTTGNTGINFAYLRYAEVLLTYAEADYKLTGAVSAEAERYLDMVRERAFRGATKPERNPDFLKAVLDERKWEFAGENMRWKDLVRNNLYSEALYYTFMRYWCVAGDAAGTGDPALMDQVQEYSPEIKFDALPTEYFTCMIKNPGDIIPNKSLALCYFSNPYTSGSKPTQAPQAYLDEVAPGYVAISAKSINEKESSDKIEWATKACLGGAWVNSDASFKPQILYSFYGYIRGTESGYVRIIRDGNEEEPNVNNLPAVRYLFPYPETAITRSNGEYYNKYKY